MKNRLVKNTIILIITSLIVRVLSLFNRIILTRLLGNQGISLYVISLPSIMLFMSIAGFSLNIVLAKIFSENSYTKKYSEKKILTSAITIGLITSSITSLILIISIKPLVYQGLKQPDTFYPILSCILFLPLVAMNNILRGYFNGKNHINISAYANLIEQVSRILIATIFLYLFLPYGLIVSVTMAIISMGLGEAISLIYTIIVLRKYKIDQSSSSLSPTQEIINIGLPTTFSRLIGNLTAFLEPIIYTLALTLIGLTSEEILYKYSAITAYAIPLITLCSFVSQSIATAIIPNISRSSAANNLQEINFYIKKSCILSLIPGILVSILLATYGNQYMKLIYDTSIGANYVIKLGFFFIVYYIQAPLYAIMQALGKQRFLFKFNIITSLIKLIIIFSLTFIPWIAYDSLIFALLLNTMITTLYIYFYLKNTYHFRFLKTEKLNLVLLTLLTYLSLIILKAGLDNYLLNTFILTILFIVYSKILKITRLRDK